MKVSPGDIVCSIAGRDKDCYFVVTAAHDNFAYICDGKCRKIEKPKKKKKAVEPILETIEVVLNDEV